MSSVIVRNSSDKPFGRLANDAILPFKVNSRTYTSVVNYVYANLLPDSTFKEELSRISPDKVLSTYKEVRHHLKRSTIQSAVYHAVSAKVKQNLNFSQALMDTENSKILYRSENEFLGIGRTMNGENIYGLALEQVRNEVNNEQNKDSEKDNIYLSYIAEINLKKALRKHNLEKYISKDKKRSMRRLVESLVRDYGKTEVYTSSPDLDTIMTLHEKRNIVVYNDPNTLIRIIRKNGIRNVLKRNMYDLRVTAFHAIVDYIISKNITLSEDKTALKDQIYDILPSKRDEFANRILDLFSAKALPDDVKEKIKKFKAMWYFPSDKDIEFFEKENVKLPDITSQTSAVKEADMYTYVEVEDNPLSPLDISPLTVKNLKFKSISHYIAFELNKLYGSTDYNKLYIRMKDLRMADLDQFNKIFEKDTLSSTKNRLLENAINLKLQQYHIKNLLFSIEKLKIEDTFDLNKTNEFYNKYKDKIVLKIQKIPSFDQFVENDPFLIDIIKDKVDFYFMILDNLMVHLKSKHQLNVAYDELVQMSPFYHHVVDVAQTMIPDYLIQKNKQYGLHNQSLLQIWSIIFNGMKQAEKIVGKNDYDIRYKSLLVWSKYFLGQSNHNIKTFEVMESQNEDIVLQVLLAILTKLKEVNLKFNVPSINIQDLRTARYLCLGEVRPYKPEYRIEEVPIELEEEVEPDLEEIEVYDDEDVESIIEANDDLDEDFEGFNLSGRRNFEAFLTTYFAPLKCELGLHRMEEAVYKILNSQIPSSVKHQNINFFSVGFRIP